MVSHGLSSVGFRFKGAVLLKMLQTGVEEFKIFLWKISHPNIKFYFGFIPQQKNEKKLIPQQQRKGLIIEACNRQRNESSELPE